MAKQNWRKVQPTNLKDAMQWCVKHAKAEHNRSVESIADLMGVNHWTLYKWMDDADMPAKHIRGFEFACGIDLVSRWLVTSNGKLVIEPPRGKKCTAKDINRLQQANNACANALIDFYNDALALNDALTAIQTSLEQTAWHQGNVKTYQQPQLPFE